MTIHTTSCEETHVFLMYPAFQDDYPGVKIMSRLPLQSGIIQVHALQNLELALSHASTTKAH